MSHFDELLSQINSEKQADKNEEFFKLVSDMRTSQKEYFKTRDANVLNESKRLEKLVDKALQEHEEDKFGGRLF